MSIDDMNKRIERGESFIVANDGQFLGKLCLNRYDVDSILHQYGPFGSAYSVTSIYNKYSIYGSPYSSLSPFNPYTSTPPNIYLRGIMIGVLSVNLYLYQSVDPNRIEEWMKSQNLYY